MSPSFCFEPGSNPFFHEVSRETLVFQFFLNPFIFFEPVLNPPMGHFGEDVPRGLAFFEPISRLGNYNIIIRVRNRVRTPRLAPALVSRHLPRHIVPGSTSLTGRKNDNICKFSLQNQGIFRILQRILLGLPGGPQNPQFWGAP